jgi:hypothetical protein
MKMPAKTASSPGLTTQLLVMILASCATLLPASAAPSIVGLWRFDEGSGTNVADSSGLGNDGTLAGENGNVPGFVTGQPGFGYALSITNDGSDHAYVTIPAAPSLMIGQTATNPWTITAWAYEVSGGASNFVATYGRILVIDDGTAFQFESGATNDAQMYTWSRFPGDLGWEIGWGAYPSVAPLLDQWVHWAVVYDGTNLSVYRDANTGTNGGFASQPVTAVIGGYFGFQDAILIGSELAQPANRTWNGMLDDVAVFAGALTQSQIATVMSGDFSAFIGGPAGIVSQPQSQTVPQGSIATLTVGADGQPSFQYQWYFNGTNQLPSASNPTATNQTLVLANVQLNQSGTYSVVVSNALGSITSSPAALVVYSANLVGLWRFNETSGTTVLDSSGLGNNGTIGGESTNFPVWVAGQTNFGGALRFTNDGANHAYVVIPGSATLMIGQTATNPWTITAWAYEDSDGTSNFVATYGHIVAIDDGLALYFESGAAGDAEM